jgi:hypothetical protein
MQLLHQELSHEKTALSGKPRPVVLLVVLWVQWLLSALAP